jgi:hypothetical protein
MEEDLYYALTNVDTQRVHITLNIDDFDCITEEKIYVFYNKGDKTVSTLPLSARERKTQRNMKVEDSSKRNLVFIPSSSSTEIFVKACTLILEKADSHLDEDQKGAFAEIKKKIEPNLSEVFKYKPDSQEIKSVYEDTGEIFEKEIFKKKTFEKKTSEEAKEFLREIFPLVEIVKQYNNGLYYPLVALPEPFQSHNYMFVKSSVERLGEYPQYVKERLKILTSFGLLGRFTFSFVPELHPGISNHVRIYAPEGLLIRDVGFDLFSSSENSSREDDPRELEERLNKEKKNNFDEKCFYIQLGPQESTTMCRCGAYFNVEFGLSKKRFHIGILPLLSSFLWLTVISPMLFKSLQTTQFILMVLALSVTILVAIGVYAIDKKIVNHYIVTHVVLAFLVLAAEIIYMVVN